MLRFLGGGVEGYSPKPLPQITKACVLPKKAILRYLHMLRILRVRAEGACPKLFPEKSEACVAEE